MAAGAEAVVRGHGRAAALAVILAPLSDAHGGNRDPRSFGVAALLGRAAQRAARVPCLIPHAHLRFLRPEDRLAVGEGENVGQKSISSQEGRSAVAFFL